jgi:hypothetical protein
MRHKLRKFNSGLWVTPAEDELPAGALRRGRGVNALKTSSIRSRTGLTTQHALNAHSITRFGDVLHYGVGTSCYRAAVAVRAGLSGDRLRFTAMPPIANIEDYLFVTNGDTLFKIDTAGNDTNWGIEDPNTELLTAAKLGDAEKMIDSMEQYAPLDGSARNDADERWRAANQLDGSGRGVKSKAVSTKHKEGTKSLLVRSYNNTTAYPNNGMASIAMDYYTLRNNAELDLTTFTGGADSTDEDFISFWIRMKEAKYWDYFQLDFSCGSSDFDGVVYSKKFVPVEGLATGTAVSAGDLSEYTTEDAERHWVIQTSKGRKNTIAIIPKVAARIGKKAEQEDIAEKFSSLEIYQVDGVWQQVKIAKKLFDRTGDSSEPYDWENVRAIRFTGVSNNLLVSPYFWLDDLKLGGGVGMQGTYQYNVTFRNSTTGHRSNGGDDVAVIDDVRRESVTLSNVPVSTDAQVDQREIWRTIGGGTLFWLCDRIDNNTATTFTDTVSDPDQNFSADATVLTATELPLDNAPPYDSFTDCVYHNGAAFWLDSTDGRKGNVHYSPVNRTESMKGYVRVTNDDDPLQRLFLWSGNLHVISESGIFRISGSDPYAASRVFGCPGTTAAETVTISPMGVFYEADQNVVFFNGMRSVPAKPEAISGLFRGEASEELTSFTGVVAAAGKDECFISDGSQTLAFNWTDGTWRDFGIGFDALHYSKDSKQLFGTYSGATYEVEDEGVYTDGGAAIAFSFQPETLLLDEEKEVLIQHIHIDADPGGQTLTVTILIDGASTALGTISDAARTTNTIAIGRYGQRVAVRLTGSLTAQVEVFGVEITTSPAREQR